MIYKKSKQEDACVKIPGVLNPIVDAFKLDVSVPLNASVLIVLMGLHLIIGGKIKLKLGVEKRLMPVRVAPAKRVTVWRNIANVIVKVDNVIKTAPVGIAEIDLRKMMMLRKWGGRENGMGGFSQKTTVISTNILLLRIMMIDKCLLVWNFSPLTYVKLSMITEYLYSYPYLKVDFFFPHFIIIIIIFFLLLAFLTSASIFSYILALKVEVHRNTFICW